MTFRAVIVAAVSTPEQAVDDKRSLPEQLESCRAVCQARGWQIAQEIVIPGHSRDYLWLHELMRDCAEFAQLVSLIESQGVNLVVCRVFDRLWRTSVLQSQISALCLQHKCQIFSVMQPVEPTDPNRLPKRPGFANIVPVFSGLVTDEEQNRRVDRLRTGMSGRIARGLHGTSGAVPYGYRVVGPRQPLEPAPETAPWARWILERRAQGEGYVAIAQALDRRGIPTVHGGAWSAQVISQIVHNAYYAGVVQWGPDRNERGAHQPLIDAATWQRIQEVNVLRANRPYRTNRLFSGLCRCAYCGSSMVYQVDGDKVRLQCCNYCRSGGKLCRYNGIYERRLRAFVLDAVMDALRDPQALLVARDGQQNLAPIRQRIATLDAEIARIASAYGRWDGLYESGGISGDELLAHRQRLFGQRDTLAVEQHTLASAVTRHEAARERILSASAVVDTLPDKTDDDLRDCYRQIIQTIVLSRESPPLIEWW